MFTSRKYCVSNKTRIKTNYTNKNMLLYIKSCHSSYEYNIEKFHKNVNGINNKSDPKYLDIFLKQNISNGKSPFILLVSDAYTQAV